MSRLIQPYLLVKGIYFFEEHKKINLNPLTKRSVWIALSMSIPEDSPQAIIKKAKGGKADDKKKAKLRELPSGRTTNNHFKGAPANTERKEKNMTLIDQHINDIEIKSYIEAIIDITNNENWSKEQRKDQIHGVGIAAAYDKRINTTQLEMVMNTENAFINTLK